MKTITKRDAVPLHLRKRKRVAAYARVSSGKDAMLHSLSAQISHYSDSIHGHAEWEFAGVYADEATGTSQIRSEFQRLLCDCRAGKIDLILTKSVSRFARNTVTTLETIRELKSLGVDVYFEKENIHSMSGDGEVMLSILASYAQEESRSVSENCKWRIRRDFKEGKPNIGRLMGYRLKDGVFVIVPEEAEIVRRIFTDYLSGMGLVRIRKSLQKAGVSISRSGIHGILRNEKYIGCMLLQKTFVSDHLTKRKVKNTGQLPQYHIENSHEAIIDRKTFEAVQAEISRRASIHKPKKQTEKYPFTGLIKCSQCGAPYKRKRVRNAEKIVWICATFNELGKSVCASQQIPETILMQKVAEVGGLGNIREIQVPAHHHLVFVFKDGRTVDAEWQNPSRRESWTPKMKQIARERQLKINEKRRCSL